MISRSKNRIPTTTSGQLQFFRLQLIALLSATALGPMSLAQDMPLHTILKKGAGWRNPGENEPLPPAAKELSTKRGFIFAIRENSIEVTHTSDKKVAHTETLPFKKPGALGLWYDQGTLVVADNGGKHIWAFRIEKDGKLTAGDKYYPLRVGNNRTNVETTAVMLDGDNRLYAATDVGIQIFDPTGRLCGVITAPDKNKVTRLVFGGTDHNLLFAETDQRKIFVREMLARGIPTVKAKKDKK